MNNGKNKLKLTTTRSDLLCLLMIVLFVVLAGGNTVNPDIKNYELVYKYGTSYFSSQGAWLYSWLQNVFIQLGASFRIFRLFVYFMGFVVLNSANKRLTDGSPFFWVFYAVALLLMDSTQTYNYMGMCFLVLGIALLIKAEKGNRFLFVVCLVIASGFHAIFVLYIPFVFIYSITDSKQLTKLYCAVMIVVLKFVRIGLVSGLSDIKN